MRRHFDSTTRRLPEYGVWNQMLQRCSNPKQKKYSLYGARGIRVCERWHTFIHFWNDMGERPSPQHTLDRIDVNGHYEPGNCRWILQREQQQNRRDNVKITYQGETLCASEWNRRLNLPRGTIEQRMNKLGWGAIEAMTTPRYAKYHKALTSVKSRN